MKLILILSVIVAIAFSYSGISPRSDYHCDGNVSGSFWDG